MDEQSIDVWAAATSLAEILAQHARYGGDGLLHSWIHVSPSGAAALRLRSGARDAVEGLLAAASDRMLLAAASDRTRLFFRLAQAPSASIDVGADPIYNDYPSYLRVLDALARFVEDADFAMRFEQEDDAGDDYYVVDACRIHGGALSVARRLTRTPERSEGAG